MKLMGKLKGNFGSTRDIDLSEDGKYICTASIDRYLRYIISISKVFIGYTQLKLIRFYNNIM